MLTLLNHISVNFLRITAACLVVGLTGSGLFGQKVLVLTDADVGQEVATGHHFTGDGEVLKVSLKHRISHMKPMEVVLKKEDQYGKGAFKFSQTFPMTLSAGKTADLSLTVDYGKAIQESNSVDLWMYPVGNNDPASAITVSLKVTAEGKLMFWSEVEKRYTTALPVLEFRGSGQKLIELTWNGKGSGEVEYVQNHKGRRAFSLVPNTSGAAPLYTGSSIDLNKGGNSYFVRYNSQGRRQYTIDEASIIFREVKTNGQQITVDVAGRGGSGRSFFASAKEMIKNSASGNYRPPANTGNTGNRNNANTGNTGNSANPNAGASIGNKGTTVRSEIPINNLPRENRNGSGNGNGAKKPVPRPIQPKVAAQITDPVLAKQRLQNFFDNNRQENFLGAEQVKFTNVEGYLQAKVPFGIDSLQNVPDIGIDAVSIAAIVESDTIELDRVDVDLDSMLLKVQIPSEAEPALTSADSFQLHVEFLPEYMAGNNPVYIDDDRNQVFTGSTIAKIDDDSHWWMWLWIAVGAFVLLFFVLGRLWIRRPVTSFRYLRESRYQRERHQRNEADSEEDIETVHLDLSRHETDLIQLSFRVPAASAEGATHKTRDLQTTVTPPARRGLKAFFSFFYGIFGVKKAPRFNAVYYSLRVEMVKGGIPQHLRLKDDQGLLLLGTSLTGNVLATDHQDFRFTKRPFTFSIFLDPAEILDYSGAMRTVSIPFKVVEEPFEGYVVSRDLKLNLEIAPKY